MRASKFTIAVAAVLGAIAIAAPASAQSENGGAYISARAGVVMSGDSSFGNSEVVDQKTGFDVGGAIGYRTPRTDAGNFRVELEGHYAQSGINSGHAFGPLAAGSYDGEVQTTGLMANAYYDLSQLGGRVVPYVGAGLGFESVDFDARGGAASFHGRDTVFAYQAMAGLEYKVSDHLSMTLEGRYFDMDKPKFSAVPSNVALTPTPVASYDLDGFKALVGVRYAF